jgi:hypothetical protein
MPPTVLMVAEKPSICTAIANALSKGNMQTRGIMYIPRIYIPISFLYIEQINRSNSTRS